MDEINTQMAEANTLPFVEDAPATQTSLPADAETEVTFEQTTDEVGDEAEVVL